MNPLQKCTYKEITERYKSWDRASHDSEYDSAIEYEGVRGVFSQCCPKCATEHSVHTVNTQTDNDPEFYTEVSTFCACGGRLEWLLPVN